MSWRKNIGWRGPLSFPVSLWLKTGALNPGAAGAPCPATGRASKSTAIPPPHMHHSPFVINAIASMAKVYDVWLCCAAACGLAAADLVHPHPLPRRAEVHDLLGDVLQRPEPLAGPFEAARRPRRQVAQRGVDLGPLPRVQIEVRGPILGRWLTGHWHDRPPNLRHGSIPTPVTGRDAASAVARRRPRPPGRHLPGSSRRARTPGRRDRPRSPATR